MTQKLCLLNTLNKTVRRTITKLLVNNRFKLGMVIYIKAIQITFKFKDKILRTQIYPAINNKVLNAKSWAREIANPTDKIYRTKNRVDKDKTLNTKSLVTSKTNETIKKHPLGSNPSGYLQGKGFITQKKALTLYY